MGTRVEFVRPLPDTLHIRVKAVTNQWCVCVCVCVMHMPLVTSSCGFGLWLCCSLVAVMIGFPFQMPLRNAQNAQTGDSSTAES